MLATSVTVITSPATAASIRLRLLTILLITIKRTGTKSTRPGALCVSPHPRPIPLKGRRERWSWAGLRSPSPLEGVRAGGEGSLRSSEDLHALVETGDDLRVHVGRDADLDVAGALHAAVHVLDEAPLADRADGVGGHDQHVVLLLHDDLHAGEHADLGAGARPVDD